MPYKDKNLTNAASRRSYNKRKANDPSFLKRLAAKALVLNQANISQYLVKTARANAKKKKLPFNLTTLDVHLPNVCPVFKTPFVYNTPYAASLDRIIPAVGYIKDNVQIISRKANTMKNNASPEELKEFARWVLSQ